VEEREKEREKTTNERKYRKMVWVEVLERD